LFLSNPVRPLNNKNAGYAKVKADPLGKTKPLPDSTLAPQNKLVTPDVGKKGDVERVRKGLSKFKHSYHSLRLFADSFQSNKLVTLILL